jgi:rhamnose utilization protein RhaD (predicted bifunctional aldolase and dehydrogenase)/NAD(P)-dependent dehydrogenase (short-subunit alcohol dehydrogenase family)
LKSLWSNADAAACVRRYAEEGVSEDLALRVYTSRLLGSEPALVQHGGGNTSVKIKVRDVLGREVDVLCVKGSGSDMAAIEPSGLPRVRLAPLMELRRVRNLSDEEMVNAQRAALLDSKAPNPSVETLLHAWLPAKFVDHTHANAVLALTDQPGGEELCRELYGARVALAPYCPPGFALAQLAAKVFEASPGAMGMILLKHGVFSWGDDARSAYEHMIEIVDLAEARIARGPRNTFARGAALDRPPPAHELAPALRGALAEPLGGGRYRRWVLEHRADPAILAYVDGADLERYSQLGTVTPDHVIRVKPWPLIWSPAAGADPRAHARERVSAYADRYRGYFERNCAAAGGGKKMLDPWPRVVLVPGVGLFGVGATAAEARVSADIAVTNIGVIGAAESMSSYETISEAETFAMEYWSLEQAKLGKQKPKRLAGQVVAITGGGGTIGAAIARAFAAEGAAVAVLDRDSAAAARVAREAGGVAVECDVTSAASVGAAFARVAAAFGGVDILVSNAGAAWTGKIGAVNEAVLRESFELNFYGAQRAAQAAVRVMRAQGTGGCLLFNVSKQAVNPGADFGPYGLAKAATLFLSRQYAVDHGADGIRSNAVNADRIRSGLLTDDMIRARAAARGVSERDYMEGNLLGVEVGADDVAQAFVSLALADRTTAAFVTVDGGNIAAAPR